MKIFQSDIKPIFCVDITSNKHNTVLNGSEFITRSVSKQTIEEYDNKRENLEQTIKKSKLPFWLELIKFLCGWFSLIVFLACLPSLEAAWKNASILIIIGICCAILWIILHIVSKSKEKKVLTERDAESQLEKINVDVLSIHDELNIPEDAVDIDVLTFKYKLKNGEIRPSVRGMQTTAYLNVSAKMYVTPDELHVADLENVYSFKKSEIKSIITVNKRISIPTWNKEDDPRKGKFKPYKMTVSNLGDIFFKPYYILEIEKDNQTFGIYFPCYELDTIENLTGLTASVIANAWREKFI